MINAPEIYVKNKFTPANGKFKLQITEVYLYNGKTLYATYTVEVAEECLEFKPIEKGFLLLISSDIEYALYQRMKEVGCQEIYVYPRIQ